MKTQEKRAASWPIPPDVAADLREIKATSGRSIVWLMAHGLRFALRQEHRHAWLEAGVSRRIDA